MICPRLMVAGQNLPNETIKQIRCGDYLLLHNSNGSFWVQVADIKERGYFDTIYTSKIQNSRYTFGDLLRCHKRHVFEIMTTESEGLKVSNTHEIR